MFAVSRRDRDRSRDDFDDRNDSARRHRRHRPDEETPADPPVGTPTEYRSIDGTGNHLSQTELGSTDEQLLRVAGADYGDGISTPAGEDRPSAREISNALSAQQDETATNDRDLSAFLYVWGQFIDHDIDLTEAGGGEAFDIAVPAGDPYFDPEGTGTEVIRLTRSLFDESTGPMSTIHVNKSRRLPRGSTDR